MNDNIDDTNIPFDWLTYINNYDDLRLAKINTYEKALQHWNIYGKNENRTFKKILDKNTYKKQIFIITNNNVGGSIKYLHDIITHYTNVNFIQINNKELLYCQKLS